MKLQFRWLRWLVLGVLACAVVFIGFVWWWLPGTHTVDQDIVLPTRYAAGLVYAEPVTAAGVRLSLLTDTGGGLFVTRQCAKRCGMHVVNRFGKQRARLPPFRADAWIPEPTGGERWIALSDGEGDGMLGQRWFAGGVWTFDYPATQLVLCRTPFVPTSAMRRHSVPLGFRHEWGVRSSNHPRFVVSIAGDAVDALLDTGATVWLSAEALRIADDQQPAERATSFVAAGLFERWRKAHPEWRVIDQGCQKSQEAIIEIPEVEVAGWKAGPVWFTRRANENYVWMSTFMDKPITASVGGNFLRHFRVTVNYPEAIAYFEKPGRAQQMPK
jgi:hypothetical protein